MTVLGGRQAAFLDRDGVLNEAIVVDGVPHPPASLLELRVLEGAARAVSVLREAGFLTVVVTNQPDVARGLQSREVVEEMNDSLQSALGIDAIYCCFHDDADACTCRKPKPGMLLAAARDLGIDLERSAMVGDRGKDIEAGHRAGVRTVYLLGEHDEELHLVPDVVVGSPLEAAAWIVEEL
jgi:D-glycero-D-manno-heptose 1,7-bisphosphate phosphatase